VCAGNTTVAIGVALPEIVAERNYRVIVHQQEYPMSRFVHSKHAAAVILGLGGLFVAACGAQDAATAPAAGATEHVAQAQTEPCAECAGGMSERHSAMAHREAVHAVHGGECGHGAGCAGGGGHAPEAHGGRAGMMGGAEDCPMMRAHSGEPAADAHDE
jgi:hypothetical protein